MNEQSETSRLLKELVERFDVTWHSGSEPTIKEFIGTDTARDLNDHDRQQLLVELVMVDMEYRWRRTTVDIRSSDSVARDVATNQFGLPERPWIEDYLRIYPELGSARTLPTRLVANEFRIRHRWGDRPSIDEYFHRFDQDRDQLRGQLMAVQKRVRTDSRSVLSIRCPHCHRSIEFAEGDLSDVDCPSCGCQFNMLVADAAVDTRLKSRRLAHFELREKVGVGSFGSVWKALDTELDRIVALKIPRHGQLSPGEVEQFLREARAAAQLRHSHIVAVHEVGRDEDMVYIASEFVEGASLESYLKDQLFSPREATALCIQLAEALEHAHQHGVVHRDLKPANIILDWAQQAHITDFGLAKRDSGEITMTMDGKLLGTPSYMSPEQASGQAHRSDRRSDVYSLGVILFELLTGELPFRGNVRMLLHCVIHDDPPSPRRLNNSIPKDLETICLKCLEKDPRKRYATANEFADELRRFLKGQPILARSITPLGRTWRWCKRQPLGAALVGLLLLLAIGGPIVALNQASLRRSADLSREETRQAACTPPI